MSQSLHLQELDTVLRSSMSGYFARYIESYHFDYYMKRVYNKIQAAIMLLADDEPIAELSEGADIRLAHFVLIIRIVVFTVLAIVGLIVLSTFPFFFFFSPALKAFATLRHSLELRMRWRKRWYKFLSVSICILQRLTVSERTQAQMPEARTVAQIRAAVESIPVTPASVLNATPVVDLQSLRCLSHSLSFTHF